MFTKLDPSTALVETAGSNISIIRPNLLCDESSQLKDSWLRTVTGEHQSTGRVQSSWRLEDWRCQTRCILVMNVLLVLIYWSHMAVRWILRDTDDCISIPLRFIWLSHLQSSVSLEIHLIDQVPLRKPWDGADATCLLSIYAWWLCRAATTVWDSSSEDPRLSWWHEVGDLGASPVCQF